ncbi:hypothetical protein B0H13DRAFT_2340155 [Mycena leptocephala]|nr:hypothetical protein B0H13DRAFT_2340155 [Mycena leptocephala]
MVDAPTSPSKLRVPLLFDEPLAPRGTAPVYDLYDQPGDLDDEHGVDDGWEGESGREMRDSDYPLREWDRYHEFLRMTREWRNLQLLKRSGRGHDPTGATGTGSGNVLCYAQHAPNQAKIFPKIGRTCRGPTVLICVVLGDGSNFRLKRKDVSSEEPTQVSHGLGFFCEVSAFMAHLAENWDQPQEVVVLSCGTQRAEYGCREAPASRTMRWINPTESSGNGLVGNWRSRLRAAQHEAPKCSRGLTAGGKGTELLRFFVSYDIACQWHKNIAVRMNKYSPEIWLLPEGKYLTFSFQNSTCPPNEACNLLFSFNLTRDVGQTDGEAPREDGPTRIPLATSTKEMGPGARRDALDDHFNDWNYKKIIAWVVMPPYD